MHGMASRSVSIKPAAEEGRRQCHLLSHILSRLRRGTDDYSGPIAMPFIYTVACRQCCIHHGGEKQWQNVNDRQKC